jgi:dihydroorotase
MMLRALKYAAMFNTVISQHCQDNSLAKNGVMNSGYNSTVLGLPGMDSLAEEMMLWRDIQLVKKTKVHYHCQHISTAGSVELIKAAKAQGLPVTCEVTPHHLLFTDSECADYDTNFKVNPPLRTSADVAALKQAIKDGVVDALVTDHAPHLQSEKELEFLAAPFGIASIECSLGLFNKALVEPGILDWPGLIRLMTIGPAKIIGIDKGSMTVGKQADVTIFDPNAQYTVNTSEFRSKSRNCPYNGWTLKGKVEYTIVGGETRYSSEQE